MLSLEVNWLMGSNDFFWGQITPFIGGQTTSYLQFECSMPSIHSIVGPVEKILVIFVQNLFYIDIWTTCPTRSL